MNLIETNLTFTGSMSRRTKTTRIVLHHAAGNGSVEDIHRIHLNRGWCGIGYHFYIRKDGSVYRGRPEDRVGAHAYGVNSVSVGVCFEGNFENEVMPDPQREAGTALIAELLARYGLAAADVCGHREICATACPGKNFPMDAILGGGVPSSAEENLVLIFQQAAIADGYAFPKYGADGRWGSECASVAGKCVVKRRIVYRNRHATALVQRLLSVEADGLCGARTDAAIRDFQRRAGLTVDGAVGRDTWSRLLGVKG